MIVKNLKIKPLVSEKTTKLLLENKFTFIVSKSANRAEIAQIIRNLYQVTPLSINSQNYQGKKKKFRRFAGKRRNFKKVIITLKKGDKIPGFEVEKEKKDKKDNQKK